MATLKQRLHRKNSSGTYDVIHLETSADCITGTLAIAHGGTGATTAANARTNLGAAASSHNHSAANITSGTLGVARGGTGKASWSANRLMYASASTTLNQLAFPTTAGSVLCQSTSGAPYWRTPSQLIGDLGAFSFTKIVDRNLTFTANQVMGTELYPLSADFAAYGLIVIRLNGTIKVKISNQSGYTFNLYVGNNSSRIMALEFSVPYWTGQAPTISTLTHPIDIYLTFTTRNPRPVFTPPGTFICDNMRSGLSYRGVEYVTEDVLGGLYLDAVSKPFTASETFTIQHRIYGAKIGS